MASSTFSAKTITKTQGVTEPSHAPVRVPFGPQELLRLWGPHAKRYSPYFPNAADIFRTVAIPSRLTDLGRIKCYIHNTSITPDGRAYTPRYTGIIPQRLFVSDLFIGTDIFTLRSLGITHVVELGYGNTTAFYPEDIVHTRIEVPITTDIEPPVDIVDKAATFVADALKESDSHRIMISCLMGVTWSPSIAIACLMNQAGFSFREARNIVLNWREGFIPDPVIDEAVQRWWNLEMLRPSFPQGRGYREFRWAAVSETPEETVKRMARAERERAKILFP